MTLGERLRAMLDDLPAGWQEADVVLTVPDETEANRAALYLGPLGAGRQGCVFRLRVGSTGARGSLEPAVRALDRLEAEGIDGRLAQPRAATVAAPAPAADRRTLAERWDSLASTLPPDWSDLYLELELASTDEIQRGALLLGPVNPFLVDETRPAFRFRVARRFGYGAAAPMARRCLERLDEKGIAGTLRLLRAHSDTHPVLTQGPVWRDAGRAV